VWNIPDRAQIIRKLEYYSSRERECWNNGIPIIPCCKHGGWNKIFRILEYYSSMEVLPTIESNVPET
jgi:hypothetical protein